MTTEILLYTIEDIRITWILKYFHIRGLGNDPVVLEQPLVRKLLINDDVKNSHYRSTLSYSGPCLCKNNTFSLFDTSVFKRKPKRYPPLTFCVRMYLITRSPHRNPKWVDIVTVPGLLGLGYYQLYLWPEGRETPLTGRGDKGYKRFMSRVGLGENWSFIQLVWLYLYFCKTRYTKL